MGTNLVIPIQGNYGCYKCTCGNRVANDGSVHGRKPIYDNYCRDCGAKMDWDTVQNKKKTNMR